MKRHIDSEFVSGGQLGRGDSIWFKGDEWKVTRIVSGIDALVIYGKPDEGGVEQRLFKRLHSRDTKAIKRMSRGSARAANDPNGRRARFRAWHKKAMAQKREDAMDVTHNVRVTARAVAKGELPSLYDMRTVRTPIGGFRLGRDAETLRGMSLQTLGRLLVKAIRAGREDVALLLEKEIDRRAKGGR